MKKQKYCSFCGKKLILKTLYDETTEMYCDECNHVFFSTSLPCVIVMVVNANKVLLTRGINWKHPYWGLISGYIKPGEDAEKTAIREVHEEVGLEISSLEFLKTHSKKDKNLLMIAFKAKTKNISIKKSQELEDVRWFDLSHSLPVPSESIAARTIKYIFPKAKLNSSKELKKTTAGIKKIKQKQLNS